MTAMQLWNSSIDCTQKWLIEALKLTKSELDKLEQSPYSPLYLPPNSDHYHILINMLEIPLYNPDFAKRFTAENCDPDSFLSLLYELQAIRDILMEELFDIEEREYFIATNPKAVKANELLYWGEEKPSKEEDEEKEYWEEEEYWEDDPEEEEEDDPWFEDEDPCSSAENFVSLDDFIEHCLEDEDNDDPDEEEDP